MKEEDIPENYQPLAGSESRPSPKARFLGSADPTETFSITIVLRRRLDGPPMPDPSAVAHIPPSQRRRLPEDEYAAKYGAAPEDIEKLVEFARQCNLAVIETHAASRTVILSGSVAQMSKAFAVRLGRYQDEFVRSRAQGLQTETYRGYDGFIHVPQGIAESIIGVFGLDNRRITRCNNPPADPPFTNSLTVPQVKQIYNFPPNSAAGQTIAILSEAGYLDSDLKLNFDANNYPNYDVADVSFPGGGSNSRRPDQETTQDIVIAGLAALGAKIRVYFTLGDAQGWVSLLTALFKQTNDPPSVLSCSYGLSYFGDPTEAFNVASQGQINGISSLFADLQHMTICVASGDSGTSGATDFSTPPPGQVYVTYPGSDPGVLSVGGTTIGKAYVERKDENFHVWVEAEYIWNDSWSFPASTIYPALSGSGATGGGISDYFPQPPWQSGINTVSLNTGKKGRGLPDVAANASPNSGYPFYVGGSLSQQPMSGTSAAAPLWAGLIAVINAALGYNVGFVNPYLYQIGFAGSPGFFNISGAPGPASNGVGGFPGYPASPGWDACTGWGRPIGVMLLASLKALG